jgi:DNA-3-methyladenine glycosylase
VTERSIADLPLRARATLAGDAVQLAPRLLGSVVVSTVGGGPVAVRITEVEAYRGPDDPASHAFRGLTRRNAVMFDEAGHLYTYFVYGMHWCANVVTGVPGRPSAVLLRAGEVVSGLALAATRRIPGTKQVHLARGPAGLASVLGLGSEQNGVDLCSGLSAVSLHEGEQVAAQSIRCGPRVGVTAAAELPWRFWKDGAPSVSVYRRGVVRRRPSPPAPSEGRGSRSRGGQ